MPSFNKNHLADLVQREADAKAALAECKAKLDDSYASDDWNESKTAEYQRNSIRYGQLTNEYRFAREEREAYAVFEPERAKATKDSPFVRFLRSGLDGLESWEVENFTKTDLQEARNRKCFVIKGSTKSDDSSGVNITDPSVRPNVLEALKAYGGLSRMSYNFTTATGASLSIPQMDDTSEEGQALPQGGNTNEGNLNDFGSVTFGARTLTSKRIRVTREMLEDAIIDLQAYCENKALRRIGRGWDRRLSVITTTSPATLGAAAPPNGQLPDSQEISLQRAASEGNTTAGSRSISYDDLVNLIYSVPAAYREGGEMGEGGEMTEMSGVVGFILSDAAEKQIRLLKDDSGRPLWQAQNDSIATMGGGTILGFPYQRSNVLGNVNATTGIPELRANSLNEAYFGDFSYFGVRTVNSFEVFNFMDSRTMENNETEVVAFSRRFGSPLYLGPTPSAGDRWPGIPMIKSLKIKA